MEAVVHGRRSRPLEKQGAVAPNVAKLRICRDLVDKLVAGTICSARKITSGGNNIMRSIRHVLIAAIGLFFVISSAIAAELTGSEIKDMISGRSVYLETAAGSVTGTSGNGVIYYAADGTALYKTPKGVMWHGTWAIKDNTNCSNWKEAGKVTCSKYDKQGNTVSIINPENGQVRAKILKTAPGNAENLLP
jgi:hypothetical protein